MNQKIRKTHEYRDDYRKLKEQVKRHVCRASSTDREYLKKKNRFDKRECADKLYQRCSDEEIMSAKRQ